MKVKGKGSIRIECYRGVGDILPEEIISFYYVEDSEHIFGDGMYFSKKYKTAFHYAQKNKTKWAIVGKFLIESEDHLEDSGAWVDQEFLEVKKEEQKLLSSYHEEIDEKNKNEIMNKIKECKIQRSEIMKTYNLFIKGDDIVLKSSDVDITLLSFDLVGSQEMIEYVYKGINQGNLLDDKISEIPGDLKDNVSKLIKEFLVR